MLLLLRDQLIRNAGIAVFELVKNAYDPERRMIREQTNGSTDLSPTHASDPATRADLQSAGARLSPSAT